MATTDPNDDVHVSECVARSRNILAGAAAHNMALAPGNIPSQAGYRPFGKSYIRAYEGDGDGDDVYDPSRRHAQLRSRKRTS